MKSVHFGKRAQPVYGASSACHFPCCSNHFGLPWRSIITTKHKTKPGKKKIWFREVGKPGSQAVSLQELEKAAAFYSHLELNCHLKELSSAFIPKKKQLFVGSRQTGKHTENCFVGQLLLLSPCSKWQKIETIIQSRATGRRRSAGKRRSSKKLE